MSEFHRRAFLAVLLTTAMLPVETWAAQPLPVRRSPAEICSWLLARTPLGSHPTVVSSLLDRQGWHNHQDQRGRWMGAEIARFPGLVWPTFVYASWKFDRRHRLEAVEVKKFRDSI